MEKLIIWIVLLVFFYLMNRISTWKKRAATAFLVVGQRATTKEERKWGYRNAPVSYTHLTLPTIYSV